jgi:diacylglycerol kinase family enzyme
MARRPRFGDILSALIYLFRGKILEHKLIESFRTSNLLIQSDKNALMEADGIIVHGYSPFNISIIPESIQMIVP